MNGELGSRLAALEERVSLLEQRHYRPARVAAEPGAAASSGNGFWALEVLQGRSGPPFEDGGVSGSVLFAGTATTPATGARAEAGQGTVVWQEEHPVPALLAGGWSDAAGALAALGHPVRLELIRRLLAGAHTTHELAEIPDLGTSGQLYHHLRELQAAGLVVQRRRNDYAVPADRIIPCLVLVAAAQSCAHIGEIAS
jgi:hypothetical protein